MVSERDGASVKPLLVLSFAYMLVTTHMSFFWSIFRVYVYSIARSLSAVAALIAVDGATRALLSPLWGRLGDVVDRRLLLCLGSICLAVVTLPLCVITNVTYVLLTYVLIASMTALVMPLANALLADVSSRRRRGLHTGLFYGISQSSWIISGVIPGALAETLGMWSAFVFVSVLCCAGGLMMLLVEERQRVTHVRRGTKLPLDPRVKLIALMAGIRGLAGGVIATVVQVKIFETLNRSYLLFGVVSSLSGAASVMSPPLYGALADRFGRTRVLIGTLLGYSAFFALLSATWDPVVCSLLWIFPLWPGVRVSSVALIADVESQEKQAYAQGVLVGTMALMRSVGAVVVCVVSDVLGLSRATLDLMLAITAIVVVVLVALTVALMLRMYPELLGV